MWTALELLSVLCMGGSNSILGRCIDMAGNTHISNRPIPPEAYARHIGYPFPPGFFIESTGVCGIHAGWFWVQLLIFRSAPFDVPLFWIRRCSPYLLLRITKNAKLSRNKLQFRNLMGYVIIDALQPLAWAATSGELIELSYLGSRFSC